MTYPQRKLAELGEFRNGLNYSKENFGTGLKVISVKDFGDRWRPDLAMLDEIDPAGMRVGLSDLRAGDILFVRSNGNKELVGRSMLIEEDLDDVSFSGFCIRFRPIIPEVNSRFLSLFFRTPLFRRTLSAQGKGTNINNLNQAILERMDVPSPAKVVKDRIVDIAGSYDDLIENNRRRIALLEEAARLLYREWFIHFRFPGHEHLKVIDGIPEGWKLETLAALCAPEDGIQTGPFGSQLHQSDYSTEGVPVVMPKDIVEGRISTASIARIPEDLANRLGRHRMRAGDTVYGRRGEIGRRAFIGRRQDGWFCGTGCLRIRPNDAIIESRFLHEALGAPRTVGFIANQARGSTMPNLSAGAMKDVPILCPPRKYRSAFLEVVENTNDLIEVLSEQTARLAQARDLLLPRLMNGEIAV